MKFTANSEFLVIPSVESIEQRWKLSTFATDYGNLNVIHAFWDSTNRFYQNDFSFLPRITASIDLLPSIALHCSMRLKFIPIPYATHWLLSP